MGSGKDKKDKNEHKKDKYKKHKEKFTAEEDARSTQLYGVDCDDLKRMLKKAFVKDKDHEKGGSSTSAWINALLSQASHGGSSLPLPPGSPGSGNRYGSSEKLKLFLSSVSHHPQGQAALKKLGTSVMTKDKNASKQAITELIKIGVGSGSHSSGATSFGGVPPSYGHQQQPPVSAYASYAAHTPYPPPSGSDPYSNNTAYPSPYPPQQPGAYPNPSPYSAPPQLAMSDPYSGGYPPMSAQPTNAYPGPYGAPSPQQPGGYSPYPAGYGAPAAPQSAPYVPGQNYYTQ